MPIDVKRLEHGRIYVVKSDHFRFGVWDSERGGYVGIKHKTTERLHLDYDVRFGGGAVAISETDRFLDVMASLKEYVGLRCVDHDRDAEDVKTDAGRMVFQHLDDGTVCYGRSANAVRNDQLLEELRKAEADE